MSKELPKVFVNKIDKQFKNNNLVYSSFLKDKIEKGINKEKSSGKGVLDKIDALFESPNFVYKLNVLITTKDEILEKQIIAVSNGNLLTMDGEKIKISDIKDIKEKTT